MSISIKQLSIMEYVVEFSNIGGVIFRRYVDRIVNKEDAILGLYEGDIPAGVAVILTRGCPEGFMQLIFASDNNSRYELITAALDYAKSKGKSGVTARVVKSSSFSIESAIALEKAGFVHCDTAHLLNCRIDESIKEIWESTCTKGYTKLCGWLERQGFLCDSFNDVPKEVLNKTLAPDSGFSQKYNPAVIAYGQRGEFLHGYSYLAHINGQPAAITMVLKADAKSLVFELISVAKDFQGSGALLLPLTRSMDRVFSYEYTNISFCIYAQNEIMLKMSSDILQPMVRRQTTQLCYEYVF